LEVAAELGMPQARSIKFPWGVDLEHFSPGDGSELREKLGWEKEFILLSTRSWEPIYGVDTLVRAFLRAASEGPSLRLLMLGNGSRKQQIKRLVAESEFSDRVQFVGLVSHEELSDYYRAADLYVSASRSDGSSVSLMEALASGLPALVTDIPGNREWVNRGENGWLFPSGEHEDLADAALFAASEVKSRPRMSAAARATAEKKADWRNGARSLLDAYERAISD
jgi:glycosyltransferase involved in cell wall biosynthesis